MVYSDESSMGVAGASRHGGVMRHAQSNVTLVVSILVELEMQSIKMGDPQRKTTVIKERLVHVAGPERNLRYPSVLEGL